VCCVSWWSRDKLSHQHKPLEKCKQSTSRTRKEKKETVEPSHEGSRTSPKRRSLPPFPHIHTVQASTSSPLRQSFNAPPPFMHGCCCMQASSAYAASLQDLGCGNSMWSVVRERT
jgi:hypothetical protein